MSAESRITGAIAAPAVEVNPLAPKPGDVAYEEWVHTTNAERFTRGDLFGWSDDRSETGMCSGIVVESDPRHLRVRVRDIRAAVIVPRSRV